MPASHLENIFETLFKFRHPRIKLIHDSIRPVPGRKFRLDFAHPQTKVGIEISGNIWSKGGHSSGVGLMRDYAKLNLSQANGWIVFQLAEQQITEEWCDLIAEVIRERSKTNNRG
jgi:very-short-patch-repair endonuclease